MVDIDLSVFSFKTIQEARTLLKVLRSKGLSDLDLIIAVLEKKIDGNLKKIKTRNNKIKKELVKCPSCGKGFLTPVLNKEGLKIMGCSKCRHSEIVE